MDYQKIFGLIWLLVLFIYTDAQQVKFSEWKNLTTSGNLPAQVKIQNSNNNLDLAKYKEKYFLAFRTAPSHFASKNTVLYVVSSSDLIHWNFEKEVKYGCDLREPRFAIYHDTLLLYFFTGGTNLFAFEPREVLVCHTTGTSWSEPNSVHLDGFVPWRLHERKDTLYLSAYYGKNLYSKDHRANLRLFHSINGFDWIPISESPQITIARAEEGEFVFDKEGNLFATVRLEGTGALICKADKNNLASWQIKRVKNKYDSALLFENQNDIYLISRRNLDGEIDKVRIRKNENEGRMRNLIRYSITRKVTTMFKFNKEELVLQQITDLPSTGDCSYPAIANISTNQYLVMNYSNDIKAKKKNWIRGQFSKTFIYSSILEIN